MSTDLRAVGFAEVRGRLTGNRLKIYSGLLERGPSTGSELASYLDSTVLSCRPRICELVDMHMARPTGLRRNHEHEFEAICMFEARQLHEAAMRAAEAELHAPVDPAQCLLPI